MLDCFELVCAARRKRIYWYTCDYNWFMVCITILCCIHWLTIHYILIIVCFECVNWLTLYHRD